MSKGLRYASVNDLPPAWRDQVNGKISERAVLPKRAKYAAERVTIDGIKFHSKKEGRRYSILKLRLQAGEIAMFHRQVIFDLPGGIRYSCDFLVIDHDGARHYEDVKGMQTPEFIMKRKQVRAIYGIELEIL